MLRNVKLLGSRYVFSVSSERDARTALAIEELCRNYPDPFGRSEDHGHITASALVVDRGLRHVLMTHHAKLGLWLPPGGHCDDDNDLVRVCRKEVFEETGHRDLEPLTEDILDIDIHAIPGMRGGREHLHYDVRFAFTADMAQPLVISAESRDLRWVPVEAIESYTDLPSILLIVKKLERFEAS